MSKKGRRFSNWLKENIFFRVPKEDKDYVKNSIMMNDFKSFRDVLLLVFILQIAMILYRLISNNFILDTKDIWYNSTYAGLAVVCVISFIVANYQKKKKLTNSYFITVAVAINFFFAWAVIVTVLDSTRGTELTTYAYTTLALAALVVLEPYLFILSSLLYGTAVTLIIYFQPNCKFYPSVIISAASIALLISVVSVVNFARRIKSIKLQMVVLELNNQLKDLSYFDPLTNLHNRRYLTENINEEPNYGINATGVLMIDIDNFKMINDQYGHQNGDIVLIELGRIIKTLTEGKDCYSVRYGGEEFLINFKRISAKNLIAFAENLRKTVEETKIKLVEGSYLNITVSIGLSSAKAGTKLTELINNSDKNLYYSKNHGKNMIHFK